MVTVEELKAEIQEYNFIALCGGSDAVADRALAKARNWVDAKTKVAGISVDWNHADEVLDEVVLKRALYELYAYAENEMIARDKRDDAYELLKGWLSNSPLLDGAGYPQAESGTAAGATVAVVKRGEPCRW